MSDTRCNYCQDTGVVSDGIPCPMCTERERQERGIHQQAATRSLHLALDSDASARIFAGRSGDVLEAMSNSERKACPVSRGFFNYFPDAIALIARHSARSNEKHNPGEPLHWTRDKSTDHEDCIARHSLAIAVDPDSTDDGQPHMLCRAWRAMAAAQIWAEEQIAKGREP